MGIKTLTRREFLRIAGICSVGILAAACSPSVAPTTAPTVAPTTAPTAAPTSAPITLPTIAPTAAAKQPVVPTGNLVAAVSGFAEDTLDPVYASPQCNNTLNWQIYESLAADGGGKLVPELAESWSPSSDGKVWTFKLRKGIKFHNGDEMTSADVKFSIERMIGPKAKNAQSSTLRDTIDHVDAPDPYTVVVTTKAVNSAFVDIVVDANVVPSKYIQDKGEEYFAKNPVGTGPWKVTNHTGGVSVEYEAVPNHWRVTPAFQKLVVKQIPEENTRIAMLKRGDADIIDIALDSSDDVKSAGLGIVSALYETEVLFHLPGTWLGTGQPMMSKPIRQALSLAINRDEICKTLFKGFAEPAARIRMAPYTFGFDPSWQADPYDTKKAAALLAEAGYPGKFSEPVINLWSYQQPGFGWIPNLVQAVSGYWEAVGVKTKITPIDFAALRAMYMARPIDAKLAGTAYPNTVSSEKNAIPFLYAVWGSKGVAPVMNDPDWDALYYKVVAEVDEAKRIDLLRQLMNKGTDATVSLIVANIRQLFATSKQVGELREAFTSAGRAFAGIQHAQGK